MPFEHHNMKVEELFIRVDRKNIYVKKIIPKYSDDKPTIILLHDALGSVAQWRDFPDMLAKKLGNPVICYDRPGYGLSATGEGYLWPGYFEKQAFGVLPDLMKQVGINVPCILLGHSDGGTIALLFASKFRVKAIISIAAHVMVEKVTSKGVSETARNRAGIVAKLEKYHGDRAAGIFDTWVDIWTSDEMESWNILPELQRIHNPVLVIQGKDDQYATALHPKMIMERVGAHQECLLMENCGHFPHRESPAEVMDGIKSFLIRHAV
ncbi:MAG TPA: alpha/beta hydrolase [Saprospirales bacterium]|nr:alpha/beta hydrolase [Saprospirales bacterium]HRQ30763.1 alpha/beta hydrolase [Saprospiraceae bacterium]